MGVTFLQYFDGFSIGSNDLTQLTLGLDRDSSLIAQQFDYEHMIEFDESFSDGQFKKTADNSKLIALYSQYKFINIKQGISKSVKWFIDNFNTCRK